MIELYTAESNREVESRRAHEARPERGDRQRAHQGRSMYGDGSWVSTMCSESRKTMSQRICAQNGCCRVRRLGDRGSFHGWSDQRLVVCGARSSGTAGHTTRSGSKYRRGWRLNVLEEGEKEPKPRRGYVIPSQAVEHVPSGGLELESSRRATAEKVYRLPDARQGSDGGERRG